MKTIPEISYKELRLSIAHFLKKYNYIKTLEIARESRLHEDLNLNGTDIHIVCNYIASIYSVSINPFEAKRYNSFGELLDFFLNRIQGIR